ncbi:MAG: hypothetical protein K2P17_05985 [Helicobacteraceae bacterium]|nr:hypothetical protein [Helicobacteraceae bacterium]
MQNIFLAIIFAFLFNACASMGDIEKLDNLYFQNNDISTSYNYSLKYSDDDFLWAFQSGILGLQNNDLSQSIELLDKSEAFFESVNAQNGFNIALKTLASILVSNGMFEYSGNLYEAVFINHYKALAYIMLEDYAKARVEFNRANDRQRRSRDFFANKIDEINTTIQQNKTEYSNKVSDLNMSALSSTADSIIMQHYSNLDRFRAYDGYVNPFIAYVSGIFFLTQNDFDKANDLLKQAYAISQKSEIIEDLEILESRKNRSSGDKNNTQSYTWILLEDGRIPKKDEISIDLPLFFLNKNTLFFNIALPKLDGGKVFHNNYFIESKKYANLMQNVESRVESSTYSHSTQNIQSSAESNIETSTYFYTHSKAQFNGFEINNLESIISNEFSIELPYIVLTSIISSSYKAYLQNLLGEKLGILGSIGGAIFSKATSNADTRSSRILPLRFIIFRIKNQKNDFSIYGDNKLIYNFSLNEACNHLCLNTDNIIYLRILQNNTISLTHSIRRKK